MANSGIEPVMTKNHPVAVALSGISHTLSQLPAWRELITREGRWIDLYAHAPLRGNLRRFKSISLPPLPKEQSDRGDVLKRLVIDLLKEEGLAFSEDSREYEGDVLVHMAMVSPDILSNHALMEAQVRVLDHLAAMGADPDAPAS